MTENDVFQFLSEIAPFSAISEGALRRLSNQTLIRKIPANGVIFVEGEVGEHGYVVCDGRVALLKRSPNGKHLIVDLLTEGEMLGAIVMIQSRPYPLTSRAQTDATLLSIPRVTFLDLIRIEPELQAGLMKVLTERLRHSHNLARMLAHDSVEVRVISILLALAPKLRLDSKGPEPYRLAIGRQETADLCGITLETASRVMKSLEREGLVGLGQVGIVEIRDQSALEQRVEVL